MRVFGIQVLDYLEPNGGIVWCGVIIGQAAEVAESVNFCINSIFLYIYMRLNFESPNCILSETVGKMNLPNSGTSIGSSRIEVCRSAGRFEGELAFVQGGKSRSISRSSFTTIKENSNI